MGKPAESRSLGFNFNIRFHYMNEEKNKAAVYRVQSLERVLDILDCFTFQSRELNLSELGKLTKLNKTTAKR